MISKNVDMIAIAFLLAVIALISSARNVVVFTIAGPVHYFRVDSDREVHAPTMPKMPDVPRIPRIPIQRD